jgi:hypothetical protein
MAEFKAMAFVDLAPTSSTTKTTPAPKLISGGKQ